MLKKLEQMVLDMQARLLLDILGRGIESALINRSSLVPEPWQASGEIKFGIDLEIIELFCLYCHRVNCLFNL